MSRRRPTKPELVSISSLVPGSDSLTVGDMIIQQLAAGVDPTNAALAAGVTPSEYRGWMRTGIECYAKLAGGADWEREFTPDEQDVTVWSIKARQAHGKHIALLAAKADQLARGASVERITRTLDSSGAETERRITTEQQAPDAGMLRFLLERLAPDQYGKDHKIDVTIHDSTDTKERASRLETQMSEIIARYTSALDDTDDAAEVDIEVEAVDVDE